MRLGRRQQEPQVLASGPPARSPQCMRSECRTPAVTGCSYGDRRGGSCDTSWCQEHVEVVANLVYCNRHAGVSRALIAAGATGHIPAIDNRAPSLVQWIANAVEDRVSNLLQEYQTTEQQFIVDPLAYVRNSTTGYHRWERSWKLVSYQGVDVKIAIEVDEQRDGLMVARVGHILAMRAIPPWIDHRAEGHRVSVEQDAAERLEFYSQLLRRLRATVEAYLQEMGLYVRPATQAAAATTKGHGRRAKQVVDVEAPLAMKSARRTSS